MLTLLKYQLSIFFNELFFPSTPIIPGPKEEVMSAQGARAAPILVEKIINKAEHAVQSYAAGIGGPGGPYTMHS